MSDNPYIVTATSANFTAEVLEKSKQVPVLVDFWAAWCAPCQMLMPILANLAEEYQGKFVVAKVNADEQQRLAMEYGVRSLPTLKLFRHGQVVDETLGAQPESVLRAMLDRYIERPSDRLRTQAMVLHASGASREALELLEQARAEDPEYYRIHEDMLAILLDTGDFAAADQLLKSLPANVQSEPSVTELTARLEFGLLVGEAPDAASLQAELARNPGNHLARYQLSARQVLSGEYEAAMDNLLEIMRKDRAFQDDAARKGLLAIFKLLGNEGPLVARYRGKMSMLLY